MFSCILARRPETALRRESSSEHFTCTAILPDSDIHTAAFVRINESELPAHRETPEYMGAATDVMGRTAGRDFELRLSEAFFFHLSELGITCVIDCINPVVILLIRHPS